MEQLQSFEFKRPSRSQYAPVVKALVDDGTFAVRLVRGEDFPQGANIHQVQSSVRIAIEKAGARARTFVEYEEDHSANTMVVSLWRDGEGPKKPTRRRRRETVAA